MSGTIVVYMPYAESQAPESRVSPRLDSLAGKTIGLVNNGWRSLDITYREFQRVLRDKYEVARIIEKRKPGASMPLQADAFKELMEKADGVIVGLGT